MPSRKLLTLKEVLSSLIVALAFAQIVLLIEVVFYIRFPENHMQ